MTRSPCAWAMSSSAGGGIVWGMRTTLKPAAAIAAKSRASRSSSWYSRPSASGAKAP